MEFKKVQYEKLNGKQKEIYNFQKVAAELADYGFNCIKPGAAPASAAK